MSHTKKGFGEGRSPTRFSFTYEDFAQVFGCSVAAARKHAQRGNFDPRDLISILEFIQRRLDKNSLSESDSLSSLVRRVRNATG